MSRSLTLSLNGNISIINTNLFAPIKLNGQYEYALKDFNIYNSIPNIDEQTISFTSVTMLLQFDSVISFTIN